MLVTLKRKSVTVVRLLRTEGIGKVLQVFKKQLRYQWAYRTVPYRGDTAWVQGCQFDLTHPMITPQVRAAIFADQFEEYELRAIKAFLPRNFPLIELGAGMGVVSCITNRMLASPEKHIVLEANTRIMPAIERNRALNSGQFTVLNAALGYESDQLTLFIDESNYVYSSAKKTSENSVTVPTVRLSQLIQQVNMPIVSLVCDLEGMEVDLVTQEINILQDHVGVFIFEEHSMNVGDEAIENICEQLEKHHFELIHHSGDVLAYCNRKLFPNVKYSDLRNLQ